MTVATSPTPTTLSSEDQEALVKDIGGLLMRTAPEGWKQINAEFRAVGRYYELLTEAITEEGDIHRWNPSHELALNFTKLRNGMYHQGRGSWFTAQYQIELPPSYKVNFNGKDEPQWRTEPQLPAYRDELRMLPRSEENIPEWLMRRLSGMTPQNGAPRFRLARIFDGNLPDGRPSVNRAPVNEEDRESLLRYLEQAAIALPERGFDADLLSQEGRQTVPVAFHTDGLWVWPAAVSYYLRRYGVPPQQELVQQAKSKGFQPPEVDEPTRAAAAASVTGNRTQAVPRREPAAAQPEQQPTPPELSGPVAPARSAGETTTMLPAPSRAVAEDQAELTMETGVVSDSEPQSAPDPVAQTLELLNEKCIELGIADTAYRIGESAPNTWYLEQVQDGWQVGWHGDENDHSNEAYEAPMVFDEIGDAAAFLLGKLLLETHPDGDAIGNTQGQHAPLINRTQNEEPPRQHTPREAENPLPPAEPNWGRMNSEVPAGPSKSAMTTLIDPAAERMRQEQQSDGPIVPLPGEPPLTLFKQKEQLILQPDMLIDRFGLPDGNLTYEVGTPFEQRSLVPEWINRPYHVYRVIRPLRAVTGRARAWFEQPGDGICYLLPQPINELVRAGILEEVDAGEPPA